MAAWLNQCGIRSVAMQSTGVYWIAAYDILEAVGFEVYLVNAREMKNLPGHKSRATGLNSANCAGNVSRLQNTHVVATNVRYRKGSTVSCKYFPAREFTDGQYSRVCYFRLGGDCVKIGVYISSSP